MEEIIRGSAEEASKELFEKVNVNISLEGWPCAAAVVGLGMVYVIVTKIRCDSQSIANDRKARKLEEVA